MSRSDASGSGARARDRRVRRLSVRDARRRSCTEAMGPSAGRGAPSRPAVPPAPGPLDGTSWLAWLAPGRPHRGAGPASRRPIPGGAGEPRRRAGRARGRARSPPLALRRRGRAPFRAGGGGARGTESLGSARPSLAVPPPERVGLTARLRPGGAPGRPTLPVQPRRSTAARGGCGGGAPVRARAHRSRRGSGAGGGGQGFAGRSGRRLPSEPPRISTPRRRRARRAPGRPRRIAKRGRRRRSARALVRRPAPEPSRRRGVPRARRGDPEAQRSGPRSRRTWPPGPVRPPARGGSASPGSSASQSRRGSGPGSCPAAEGLHPPRGRRHGRRQQHGQSRHPGSDNRA